MRRRSSLVALAGSFVAIAAVGCSSSEDGGAGGAGGGTTSGGGGAGGEGGAPECVAQAGPLPWDLALPGAEPNGVFDLDFARDPETSRLWAVYSGVTGPAGNGRVSTHLAYREDDGATWCGGEALNPATTVAAPDLPADASGDEGHWNHETASVVHDPSAPAGERWRVVWHRYLVVDDGVPGTDDRALAYGWFAQRRAATPEELLTAPEEKLFSGLAYDVDADIQAYNDAQPGGAPQQRWDQEPALADCVLFAEPGLLADAGQLYLVSFCARDATDTRVVLVSLDHATGAWSFRGTLLEGTDGAALDPSFTGFNGADLFATGATTRLVVTPIAGDGYRGCVTYGVDLLAGALNDANGNGPDVLFTLPAPEEPSVFHWGACAYQEGSATGVVVSNGHDAGVTFRMVATGLTL
jgi:hypothetical protein